MNFDLDKIIGFDWDESNRDKNWLKHKVTFNEAEQVFFNSPLLVAAANEVLQERRWAALGLTNESRKLTIVFAVRASKIRVVSARSMTKKEVRIYEIEQKKENN